MSVSDLFANQNGHFINLVNLVGLQVPGGATPGAPLAAFRVIHSINLRPSTDGR